MNFQVVDASFPSGMPSWFRRDENAWTETDRRERNKTVAAVLSFLLLALSGLGLLVWALAGSGH